MESCRKCGDIVPEGKNFCANCGERATRAKDEMKHENERRKSQLTTIGAILILIGTIMISFGSVFYSTLYGTGWACLLMPIGIFLFGTGLLFLFQTLVFWRE